MTAPCMWKACRAMAAGSKSGCLVSTPTHHLPGARPMLLPWGPARQCWCLNTTPTTCRGRTVACCARLRTRRVYACGGRTGCLPGVARRVRRRFGGIGLAAGVRAGTGRGATRRVPDLPILLSISWNDVFGAMTLARAGISDVVSWPINAREIAAALHDRLQPAGRRSTAA